MFKKSFILILIVLFSFSIVNAGEDIKTQISAANYLAEKSIIKDNKTNPSEYRLADTITRKETMKIIMKLSGLEIKDKCEGKFVDVTNDWGCKYIEAALKAGFIVKNTKFRPNDNITKTESMKLILKAKGIRKIKETTNWQKDYMDTAFEYGIITQKYYDYNADAKRGWIFVISTATIKKEDTIIKKQGEKTYSDEAF